MQEQGLAKHNSRDLDIIVTCAVPNPYQYFFILLIYAIIYIINENYLGWG